MPEEKPQFRDLEQLTQEQADVEVETEEIDKLIDIAETLGWQEEQLMRTQSELYGLVSELSGLDGEEAREIFGHYKRKLKELQESLQRSLAEMEPDQPEDEEEEEPSPRKGFFRRMWDRIRHPIDTAKNVKEAIWNVETGKAAAEMVYKTITKVSGAKIATDFIISFIPKLREISDQYKYRKGKEELKNIKAALESYITGQEAAKAETLEGAEVTRRYEELKSKVVEAKYLDQASKQKFLEKIDEVKLQFETAEAEAYEERKKEMTRLSEGYLINGTSYTVIATDAANGLLALTPLTMLRGFVMAGGAVAERLKKNKQKNIQSEIEGVEKTGAVRDLFVNATVETARGLSFGIIGGSTDKRENVTGKQRAVDFLRSFGTIARIFGMSVVALQGLEAPAQVLSKFSEAISNDGVVATAANNFVNNAERIIDVYSHPVDNVRAAYANVAEKVFGVKQDNPFDNYINEMQKELHQVAEGVRQYTAEAAIAAAALAKHQAELAAHAAEVHSELPARPAGLVELKGIPEGGKLSLHDWREKVMEGMGYKEEHGKIFHALRFHPGAKLQLVDANGQVFVGKDGQPIEYTYGKPILDKAGHITGYAEGGSTSDGLDHLQKQAGQLIKDGKIPTIKIIGGNTGKVEVLNNYRVESHVGGKTHVETSETVVPKHSDLPKDNFVNAPKAPGNISEAKLPHVPGWKADDIASSGNHIHYVDGGGRIYDSQGKFIENVAVANSVVSGNTSGSRSGGSGSGSGGVESVAKQIKWSNGSVVENKAGLEAMLKGSGSNVSEVPAKGSTASVVDESKNTGGAGAKEVHHTKVKVPVAEKDSTLPENKKVEVVDEKILEKPVEPEVEHPPEAKAIVTLEDGRAAIESLDYLDPIEKTRLSNFGYLLEWQHRLYGDGGASLRNLLVSEDPEVFGVLEKPEVDALMSGLVYDNESASEAFMDAIQNKQSYADIIKGLNAKMPGYATLASASNAEFADKIFGTDLTKNMSDNKADFIDLEVERVKGLVEGALTNKYMQMSQKED